MSLTSPFELLGNLKSNQALGAFNVIQLEHAEAIAAAAEKLNAPVVLQLSQNAVKYHGSLKPIGLAMLAVAEQSSAQIAVHLDHAEDTNLIREAIDLGFNSVMFDGSHLSYADNVSETFAMAKACQLNGVWLEAELGEIGGKDGVHSPKARTNPSEAAEFVAATNVNGLAIAVGSSHAMTTKDAALDIELIVANKASVNVPLVLHGSSGVSDSNLTAAITAGIKKVNVSTDLNKTMTQVIAEYLTANPGAHDPRKYLGAARNSVTDSVQRYLELFGF